MAKSKKKAPARGDGKPIGKAYAAMDKHGEWHVRDNFKELMNTVKELEMHRDMELLKLENAELKRLLAMAYGCLVSQASAGPMALAKRLEPIVFPAPKETKVPLDMDAHPTRNGEAARAC